jgi:GTP cyclohydrolase I
MSAPNLPDIAVQSPTHEQALDWVGMQGIALPVNLAGQRINTRADVGVSLDDGNTRGIYMSRLYLGLQALEHKELSLPALQDLLARFLDSLRVCRRQASIHLRGELLLSRAALVSPLAGWKFYSFEVRAHQDPWGFHVELQVKVTYSSTCLCSAALARQLIQQRFTEDFADQPLDHAQLLAWLGSPEGIHRCHAAQPAQLRHDGRTPATAHHRITTAGTDRTQRKGPRHGRQTAVKRADEQAFALANGQNLMFCEDATRRLHRALRQQGELSAFKLRVVHTESLHAHDAVAVSTRNWR